MTGISEGDFVTLRGDKPAHVIKRSEMDVILIYCGHWVNTGRVPVERAGWPTCVACVARKHLLEESE